MKVIIGLGNPGKQYVYTRHNTGMLFVDFFLEYIKKNKSCEVENYFKNSKLKSNGIYFYINNVKYLIIKPLEFMNNSGQAVIAISQFYKIPPDDILVAHDDLDIMLGEYKIQKGKGPKQHNGLDSIQKSLNTKLFWRIRIGIENRKIDNKVSGVDYVLSNFTRQEILKLQSTFKKATIQLHKLLQ